MDYFTEQILTEDGYQRFLFNRVLTINGTIYHVFVKDENRLSQFFQMEEKSGVWTFKHISEIPVWVLPFESKLVAAIHEHQFSDK
jgi:hypothetical protein